MKKIILFIFIIYIGVLLQSCNPPHDLYPGRSYHLNIQFIDSKGNDLTNGIKHKDSEFYAAHYLIDKSEYIIEASTDQIDIEDLLLHIKQNSNQEITLTAHTHLNSFKYTPHEIVIHLICEKIFGNNDQHEIVTRWTYEITNSPKCVSLTLDGKPFPVVLSEDNYTFNTQITVE